MTIFERTREDLRSCLVTRTIQQDETPLLTLVERGGETPDPLIQALIDKLPKPNTIWSIDDRGKWLKAAAMAFNLVYRTAEPEQTPSDLKLVV